MLDLSFNHNGKYMAVEKLAANMGEDIYNFLQKIPKETEEFSNHASGMTFGEYKEWLIKMEESSKGMNLPDNYVPQTMFILYEEDVPIGVAKVRRRLNEELIKKGGHITFYILPEFRENGLGTAFMMKLLDFAEEELAMSDILFTITSSNIQAIKIATRMGAVLEDKDEGVSKYWIRK